MKKSRPASRAVAGGVAVVLATMLTVACSDDSGTKEAKSSPSATAAAVAPSAQASSVGTPSASDPASPAQSAPAKEVTFWGSWSGDQVAQLEKQTAAYNSAQSTYTVKYVAQEIVEAKLLTGIASGLVPDVVLWDRNQTPLYVNKGALAPIDDYIKKDGVDLAQFYDQALGEMVIDGKTYGVPLLVDNRSLFYNKTILEKAGVKPPTNWDELRSVAKAVTVKSGGKVSRAGFSLGDPGLFAMYLRQAGGSMFSEDGKKTAFNSAQGLEVLDYWKSVMDDGSFSLGFGEGVDAFAEGNLAMKYDGPWALTGLQAGAVDFGIVEPPRGARGDAGAGMGGFGLVIPTGAKNTDGAWDFIKWWTTQAENGVGFAKISGWIPANKKAANDSYFTNNPHYAAFIKTMDYAKVRPSIPGAADVEGKALIPELQRFMAGEISGKQALTNAQSAADDILAQNS